jgi:tRNA-specific 2-thiouridylase
MYVLAIRPETREVVVGPLQALDSAGVEVDRLNWLADAPAPGEPVSVQVRHRAPAVHAAVARTDPWSEGHGDGALGLTFAEPQRAVTPGQSAVIFRGEQVLGGGRIRAAVRRLPAASAAAGTTPSPSRS